MVGPVGPVYAQSYRRERAGELSVSGEQEAQEWAEAVRKFGERAGVAYEPVGGINPKDGPVALCVGGSNRLTGQLVEGFWGVELRRRRKGGRRPLQQGAGADRDPRQGAHARSGEGRSRLQRRVDRGHRGRSPSTSSARSNSSRSTSTSASSRRCRRSTTRSRCASCSAPASSRWTTTMTGEIDFGVNDRQLWFLWRLRRAQRAGTEGGAEERRPAVRAAAGGDGRERHPHLPARPLARRPGAVSRRA